MSGAISVSGSETSNKAKAKDPVNDDAEESQGEEGSSEFEIEEVLDAKRGYFPEVPIAN